MEAFVWLAAAVAGMVAQPSDSVAQLMARFDDYKAGDTVKLTVWREGKRIELSATLQGGETI